MPLTRMPNGAYVDIADGTPPEVVAKIASQYKPTSRPVAGSRRAAPTPAMTRDQQDRDRYAKKLRNSVADTNIPVLKDMKFLDSVNRVGQAFSHGGTLHFGDHLGAAVDAGTTGVARALRSGDVGEIGRLYRNDVEGARQYRRQSQSDHPVQNVVGEIAGLLVNPVGARTGVGKAATAVAEKTGAARLLAPAVEKVKPALDLAGRAASSTVGRAARAGFNQSALTGLADTGDVDQSLAQGTVGAALGGAAGGIFRGAGALRNALADRALGAAENVAYGKIAEMLGRARRPGGKTYSPQAAEREMRVAAGRGSEPMLMDLSPEMQAEAARLGRKATLPMANVLTEAGESRIAGAGGRFTDKMRDLVDTPKGTDSLALRQEITAGRKAQAGKDYDKVLGQLVRPSKALNDALTKPWVQDAIRSAGDILRNDTDKALFVRRGNQEYLTMHGFDAIKKAMDDKIETGIKYLPDGTAKVSNESRILSNQLRNLRDVIAKTNPRYAGVLAKQRDAFERIESLELGKNFIKRMGSSSDARALLQEIRQGGTKVEELRTGLADALLDMAAKSDNPTKAMRKFVRTPDQRSVLTYVFGGTKRMNQFDQFMRREIRAMRGDNMLARGTNSAGDATRIEGDAGMEDAGNLFSNVLRGQAFGGITGALSGGVRSLDQLTRGMGPAAQDELARALSGRGERLAERVAAAKKAAAARRAKTQRHAVTVGKVSGSAAQNSGE